MKKLSVRMSGHALPVTAVCAKTTVMILKIIKKGLQLKLTELKGFYANHVFVFNFYEV
jgi:hypothetical protein